jgi:hypothetical protein
MIIDKASNTNQQWIYGQHIATWNKMAGRLPSFPKSYKGCDRADGLES